MILQDVKNLDTLGLFLRQEHFPKQPDSLENSAVHVDPLDLSRWHMVCLG